jgi:DNA primase
MLPIPARIENSPVAKVKTAFPDNPPITAVGFAKSLEKTAKHYHQRFLDSAEAREYLISACGVRNFALFRDYRLGYADGSLLDALPLDEEGLAPFRKMGFLTERDEDVFAGCVIFPLYTAKGELVNLHGQRMGEEIPMQVLLPGITRGAWNAQALRRATTVFITATPMEALTLIDRGVADVVPCVGDVLNEDHLTLLRREGLTHVVLALPATLHGHTMERGLRAQLVHVPVQVEALHLPDGDDVTTFLAKHEVSAFLALRAKAAPDVPVTVAPETHNTPQGVVFCVNRRRYEVKAFQRQGTQLKATVKASCAKAKGFELHTLDLYSARSREAYAKECAKLFDEDVAEIKADLAQLLEHIEVWTPETESPNTVVMTDQERKDGLALLSDTDLLVRIERDLTKLGIAGEAINKRVSYLTATSRLLDEPLSTAIQSRSAAGKSALQNAVLSCVPPEGKVTFTRLTDQSLYYQGPTALKHKVLALEEAEALGGAAYSLRALQSSKQLTIATTSKDPATGKMRTEQYEVQGPVAVLLTTTSASLDEETASRFLTISINESPEMTESIFARQREADTLTGYLGQRERDAIVRQHHAAQRLLEPLLVMNPYADQLTFPSKTLRARRDHKKYLTLIKTIAFLHQKQRPMKELMVGDEVVRYIDVTREDIRAANAIAKEIFAGSASGLSAPARNLHQLIQTWVEEQCQTRKCEVSEVTFTRKTLRDVTGWSEWQVRVHAKELETLEYVLAHGGTQGKQYRYELVHFTSKDDASKDLPLADPEQLREPTP